MHRLPKIFAFLLILATSILCQQIIKNSRENQFNKANYAELNDIKYGLLSVDVWKSQLLDIINAEVDRLYISNATERELRPHIQAIMDKMIDKVANKVRQANKGSTEGWFEQTFIDMFVDIKDIKKGIPEYTDAVIREMKKPKTQEQIKSIVEDQLAEYATKTTDTQDRSRLLKILDDAGTDDIATARAIIDEQMTTKHRHIVVECVILALLAIIPFVFFSRCKQPLSPTQFLILVFMLGFLLLVGITTPMIDMEAKISELKILLIGHPITFDNQVLYFQTKSILDVFWVMISHHQVQMKFVGILLVLFSIVFPFLKILSSLFYYFDVRNARKNKIINFFIFKSGKWSMTDVMVVAIFMAYIGFNGIIENQLGNLQSISPEVSALTTNGTSLQPGYYIFLTYALLAVYFSKFLEFDAKAAAQPQSKAAV